LVGTAYKLSVSAVGSPPLLYQWRYNGADIPGATASNHTILSMRIADEGRYQVGVRNSFGAVVSEPAEVLAGVPPSFVQHPISQGVVAGGSLTLSAVVTGRPPPFTFTWRYEGQSRRVTNTSSEPLTFLRYSAPSLSATQRFRVVVSNAATMTPGVISEFATVHVLADGDADGSPDEWENQFGLNPADPSDATADLDEDGRSNADEYLAGTDPTKTLEVLRLDLVEWLGTETRLRFTAFSNKTYTIQSRSGLEVGQWQRLTDVAASPVTRPVEVRDALGPGYTNRFYRLVTPWASGQ
jgi:hypothetical protein